VIGTLAAPTGLARLRVRSSLRHGLATANTNAARAGFRRSRRGGTAVRADGATGNAGSAVRLQATVVAGDVRAVLNADRVKTGASSALWSAVADRRQPGRREV